MSDGKKSQYRGVYWDVNVGAWIAVHYAHAGRKSIKTDLGYYVDEEEAAKAYDEHVVKIFGDRAITNFPVAKKDQAV